MQEKRIDGYWTVDANRHLSDSWRGITKNTLLKENFPRDTYGPGERLTKVQTTTRPDHVWPEVWSKIGKAAQNREKQEWAKEKPKTRHSSTTEGNLLHWSGWRRRKGNPSKCVDKIGKAYISGHAVQKGDAFQHQETCCVVECISQGSTDKTWLKSGISWIQKATSGTLST